MTPLTVHDLAADFEHVKYMFDDSAPPYMRPADRKQLSAMSRDIRELARIVQ